MSWQLSIDELISATQGTALSQINSNFTGVGTDTRANLAGKLFVALRGEAHDAHQYLDKAVQAGAAALLVDKIDPKFETLKEKVSIIQVPDTLKAFQDLGSFWRRKMNLKVIGITGSNGKTTTKEFTAEILSSKFKTHYSKGSFNNHWGVPISLLDITPEHEIAVIEMGMNAFREIETLAKIAEPDIVVVTMVGQTQGGALGGIEGVAKAKEEIYRFAPENALQIFNLDNLYRLQCMSEQRPLAKKVYSHFQALKRLLILRMCT
jgi:UDP-N-acetylmuramoyl-tripeptide--D-alanyl-D-alanine ligase